jgi:hypothetical protein
MITIIDCNGIQGKPEYMHFKTENEGYMFCYKGGLYQNSSIFVYKTSNGGADWKLIYSQNGFYFYGGSEIYQNAIYGNVYDPEDNTNYNLFKLDLATQNFNLINPDIFGVDRVGGIIGVNGNNISVFFNKNKQSGYLTTDSDFSSFSLRPFNYTIKNGGIISDSTNIYFVTWKNQLVIETSGEYKEVAINNPACITKIAENKVLVATNEQENAITLYQYDLRNDKLENLQTFENYSIINHLQSNEKIIVGFAGNIKGMFVEYDLIYSRDKGQTWQIFKLKEKKLITPNCLVDNVLYIYSGRKLQKIVF